jgi:hypothetical protein
MLVVDFIIVDADSGRGPGQRVSWGRVSHRVTCTASTPRALSCCTSVFRRRKAQAGSNPAHRNSTRVARIPFRHRHPGREVERQRMIGKDGMERGLCMGGQGCWRKCCQTVFDSCAGFAYGRTATAPSRHQFCRRSSCHGIVGPLALLNSARLSWSACPSAMITFKLPRCRGTGMTGAVDHGLR